MLLLSRKIGETVVIGINGEIKITIQERRGGQIQLCFDADKTIPIDRLEVYQKKQREKCC